MPRGTAKNFRPHCPACGAVTTAKCRLCGAVYGLDPINELGEKGICKPIHFDERQWEDLVARAKVTPGVNGPAELVRLVCEEVLAMPPHGLISSSKTPNRPSKRR
jgi:hypothetical protein